MKSRTIAIQMDKRKNYFVSAVFITILAAIIILISVPSLACHVEFRILGEEKETYAVGDTVSVEIELMLTHGNCQVDIEATEMSENGVKILRSTKWKRIREKPVTSVRQFVLLITGDIEGDITLRAERLCERQGCDVSILLIAEEERAPDEEQD